MSNFIQKLEEVYLKETGKTFGEQSYQPLPDDKSRYSFYGVPLTKYPYNNFRTPAEARKMIDAALKRPLP